MWEDSQNTCNLQSACDTLLSLKISWKKSTCAVCHWQTDIVATMNIDSTRKLHCATIWHMSVNDMDIKCLFSILFQCSKTSFTSRCPLITCCDILRHRGHFLSRKQHSQKSPLACSRRFVTKKFFSPSPCSWDVLRCYHNSRFARGFSTS